MSKILGVLLAWAVACGAVGAHSSPVYILEGTVTDRASLTPIVGAQVTLVTARRSVQTTDAGTFQFGPRPVQGPDQMVITHPDYRTVRIPLGDLGGDAWHLDITLVPAPDRGEGTELSGVERQ